MVIQFRPRRVFARGTAIAAAYPELPSGSLYMGIISSLDTLLVEWYFGMSLGWCAPAV